MLGLATPINQVEATIVAVIHINDDDEHKLVATIDGSVPSEHEITKCIFRNNILIHTSSLAITDNNLEPITPGYF